MKSEQVRLGALIEYPTGDGKPMAENRLHFNLTAYLGVGVLEYWARNEPLVYVSGNDFIFPVEGDPDRRVSPDCYVVKGVGKHLRESFKVWEEDGHTPCFVIEFTSKGTARKDLGEKKRFYRDILKVGEYFLFDPKREHVFEGLRGFRLKAGRYLPIHGNAQGRFESLELGLELAVSGRHLRFYEPGSHAPIPTQEERAEHERGEKERERGEKERERSEKERERSEKERERGEKERERGEKERERARAEQAEGRLARLQEELDRLRGRQGQVE